MRGRILLLVCTTVGLLCAHTVTAFSQAVGDFRSAVTTGNWSAAASWETYDGAVWNAAGGPPAGTSGTITIQSGHTITVDAAITINGSAVVVDGYLKDVGTITRTSGTFTFNSGATFEFAHAPASGTGIPNATWNTGSTCIITGVAGATTGINATQNFYNLVVNSPGWGGSLNLGWNSGTTTISGTVTVKNTGTGRWQWCAPVAGTPGAHTIATVNVLGDLIIDGSTTDASNMVQVTTNGTSNNYGDITITISGNVTVTGNPTNNTWTNFNISRGSQGTTGTCVWNLLGDFTMSDATVQNSNVTGTNGKFAFSKSAPQTLTWSNINYASNLINMQVNSGSTLNLGTSVIAGNGAFIVSSGGGLATAHASGINGNITTTGTKTLATDANYTFNGSVAQVTGALLPSTVNDLTINNSAGVTPTSGVAVNGTLNLTSGKLTLGTNNVTAAVVSGGSASNYVVTDNIGVLKINSVGASNITFPVGTASSYNPATINNSGTADNFSVRVSTSFSNPPSTSAVVNREWTITEDATGANATVALQWSTADEDPSFVRTGATFIGRYTGSQWVQTGATFVDLGGGVYNVTAGGFTAFSPFGIGNDGALPIQLASFTANVLGNQNVHLAWTTLSELNNFGFYVQKRLQTESVWNEIENSFLPGHGTTNEPQHYSFIDNVVAAGSWQYRLRQVDLDGAFHFSEPLRVDVVTSVNEAALLQFALLQNYPNPFNPSTEIKFSVAATDRATIEVYNTLGQKVATLFNGIAQAGEYQIVRFNGDIFASGTYFYRLLSGTKSEMKKFMLVK